MEKLFLEILHNGEVMNEPPLEMLKGGKGNAAGCDNYQLICICYNGGSNSDCSVNQLEPPTPIEPDTPKP